MPMIILLTKVPIRTIKRRWHGSLCICSSKNLNLVNVKSLERNFPAWFSGVPVGFAGCLLTALPVCCCHGAVVLLVRFFFFSFFLVVPTNTQRVLSVARATDKTRELWTEPGLPVPIVIDSRKRLCPLHMVCVALLVLFVTGVDSGDKFPFRSVATWTVNRLSSCDGLETCLESLVPPPPPLSGRRQVIKFYSMHFAAAIARASTVSRHKTGLMRVR